MNVADYFQQTATLKRKTGVNTAAETTLAAGVSIDVRWYYENKAIRDDNGREVLSSAHISTLSEVSVQDVVTDEDGRDREVIQARKNRDVDGNFSHYVAYLT